MTCCTVYIIISQHIILLTFHKAQEELGAFQREQRAVAVPQAVPGQMNLPGIEKKGKDAHNGPTQDLH